MINCCGCPELSCAVDVEEFWGARVRRTTCECEIDAEPGGPGCARRDEDEP